MPRGSALAMAAVSVSKEYVAFLRCLDGQGDAEERVFMLDRRRLTIGRDGRGADIIVDDPTSLKRIGRRHAELVLTGAAVGGVMDWKIVDLGSVNGMVVNGVKQASATVQPARSRPLQNKSDRLPPTPFPIELDSSVDRFSRGTSGASPRTPC